MEEKLLNERESLHVNIRVERKREELKKKRNKFMENVLEKDVTKEKFREMYEMILEGKVREKDEGMFLSELAVVVRHDSGENEVGQYMGTVLEYLVEMYKRSKNKEKREEDVNNILSVFNNITYFISDISPHQRQIFEIAQQCMVNRHFTKNAIILLTNLSSFNIYQQMIQYMSSQPFLSSLIKIVQTIQLKEQQKSLIIDIYSNLLLDNNSNKQDLWKNMIILKKLIEQTNNIEISYKTIICLKALIVMDDNIIDELDFQLLVHKVYSQKFQISDEIFKKELLDLFRRIVKKPYPELVQSLLEKGILTFISSYQKTQSQNQHNTVVRMVTQILYVIQEIQHLKHYISSPQLTKTVFFYLKQYNTFSFPHLKQSIIQMLCNFQIQKLINTTQFHNFLQNFKSSSQTPDSHQYLLLLFCHIIQIQDTPIQLQTKISTLLQNILKQNENNTIKNKVLKLLQYIEQTQQ